MASSDATVLSQGVGYGVVVGIGFLFSLVMMGISTLQVLYTLKSQDDVSNRIRRIVTHHTRQRHPKSSTQRVVQSSLV